MSLTRLFGGLTAAMLYVLLSVLPASAESLTFTLRSSHPNAVAVVFYSEDGGEWPGDGKAYLVDDDALHSYPLECKSGERICYGAWVQGDQSTFWGSGPGGKESCSDCCYSCGGETEEIHLSN